jgi:hypothetical protein
MEKYKSKIVDGFEVFFRSDWISDLERPIHFEWYYNQAQLVYQQCNRDQKLLEIGVGTSLLSDLLKRRGWNIVTLDIDEEKKPSFCGDALEFNYDAHNIEVILAFEIFEHIPFETFEKILKKFSKSNLKNICFSVPWCEREWINLKAKLPMLKPINFRLSFSSNEIHTKSHFWELSQTGKILINGKRLLELRDICNLFHCNGFDLVPIKKVGYIQFFLARRKS